MPRQYTNNQDGYGANELAMAGQLWQVVPFVSDAAKMQKSNKFELVTTVTAFRATESHQLSLEVGDLVEVLAKDSETWWKGRKVIGKASGVFPVKYVQPIKGRVGATLVELGAETKTKTTTTRKSGTESKSNKKVETPEEGKFIHDRVLTTEPYEAERDDEMSIETNDVLQVIERRYAKWWLGCNERTGEKGFFPVKSTKPQQTSQAHRAKSIVRKESRREKKVNTSSIHSKDHSDDSGNHHPDLGDLSTGEFSSVTTSSESSPRNSDLYTISLLDSPTVEDEVADNESPTKRQNSQSQRFYVICELIETEQKFVEYLLDICKNFKGPMQRSGLIEPIEEIDIIFEHLEKIYNVHLTLYEQLNSHFKSDEDSCIGAILRANLLALLPVYREYCSGNMTQLLVKIDDNERFDGDVEGISTRQQTYQKFKSGALRPMQRITKYPLLIDKILELTPDGHIDHEDCKHAVENSKSLCEEINQIYDRACNENEPFKKLFWVQQHIILPNKQVDQTIDFNSETLFLGPRVLLHSGILFTGTKMLFAFLFNDFLLLALPDKESCFSGLKREQIPEEISLFDHAQTRDTKCTLYKRPFILGDLFISLMDDFEAPINPNSFKLECASLKRQILLRSPTYNEWHQWLEVLRAAKEAYMKAQSTFDNIPEVDGITVENGTPTIAALHLHSIIADSLYARNYAVNVYCKVAIGTDWSSATRRFRTHTVRRVMDFRKGGKSRNNLLSKLAAAAATLQTGGEGSDNPQQISWTIDRKLDVTDSGDLFLVRCYDASPFAPHQLLGETSLPIENLSDSTGIITKGVPLEISSAHWLTKLNIKPCLLLKLEFIPCAPSQNQE